MHFGTKRGDGILITGEPIGEETSSRNQGVFVSKKGGS